MGDLSSLLQEVLTTGNKDLMMQVALVAGKSKSWVAQQCYGNINVSVEAIKAAWLVTRDPRFKKILEPTGFELRPSIESAACKSTEQEALGLVATLGKFIDCWERSIADDQINKEEALSILTHLNNMEQKLARLKKSVVYTVDETWYDSKIGMAPAA